MNKEAPKKIYLVNSFDEFDDFDWEHEDGIYWSSSSVNASDIKFTRTDLVEEASSKIIDLCTDEHGEPYDNLFKQIIKIAKEIK